MFFLLLSFFGESCNFIIDLNETKRFQITLKFDEKVCFVNKKSVGIFFENKPKLFEIQSNDDPKIFNVQENKINDNSYFLLFQSNSNISFSSLSYQQQTLVFSAFVLDNQCHDIEVWGYSNISATFNQNDNRYSINQQQSKCLLIDPMGNISLNIYSNFPEGDLILFINNQQINGNLSSNYLDPLSLSFEAKHLSDQNYLTVSYTSSPYHFEDFWYDPPMRTPLITYSYLAFSYGAGIGFGVVLLVFAAIFIIVKKRTKGMNSSAYDDDVSNQTESPSNQNIETLYINKMPDSESEYPEQKMVTSDPKEQGEIADLDPYGINQNESPDQMPTHTEPEELQDNPYSLKNEEIV